TQQPGTVSLESYWSAANRDYATVASAAGKAWATNNGYVLAQVEGYIYPTPMPGTQPLMRYQNATRHDSFTTSAHPGSELVNIWLYDPDHLNLWLDDGADGGRQCSAPTTTEQTNVVENSWYASVYAIAPDYPDRLLRRADRTFRAGDFTSAKPLYDE